MEKVFVVLVMSLVTMSYAFAGDHQNLQNSQLSLTNAQSPDIVLERLDKKLILTKR